MKRIDDLLHAMTLAEKLGQMTMSAASYAVTGPVVAGDLRDAVRTGAVGCLLNLFGAARVHEMQRLAVEETRLKIPLLIGLDVLHGYKTLFPVPLGEAALFDPDAWEKTAREAAKEAAADGVNLTFAPMLDVSRDPRWGRSVEGPGEDPWVAARFARAKVKGFQDGDLAGAEAIAAVAKHYCAYGAVMAGREYASADISDRTLREVHLPPFAAAVQAGVALVMPAFIDLAGVPMTANGDMLNGWLRGELGFDGVVVSDYNAVAELIHHGIASDLVEAAALALKAGVDIDMMGDAYRRGLPVALERGLVDMREIDSAVRRVLLLKEKLGLFDDPYHRGSKPERADTLASRRHLAREIGARSIVLLKNDRGALPLPKSIRRIALIGPFIDSSREMRGPWSAAAEPEGHVGILAGFRAALPGAEVISSPGVGIDDDNSTGISAAVELVHQAERILLCLGEAAATSGEAASRANPGLPGRQRELAEAIFDVAQTLNKPVTVILFSGRALIVPWLVERADAILAAWFPGSEAGHAIADIVTGAISPSGRTPMSWPRAVGQIPIFFAERSTGRPADPNDHFTSKYLDVPNSPLFAFGHGLSYGHFIFSNLNVSPASVSVGDVISIEVDVMNDGAMTAEETAFLFVHDKVASVSRPLLELKGFSKIILPPGERGTVRLSLPATDLCFLGRDLKRVFESGDVEILVGPCADREKLLVANVLLLAESDV
ncbi:MAG: glycoside hydrolase family 3 N-terminal domain-containing protein [Methylovirgula sp.]